MRPGRTQTGMNFYQYETFATVYMKPGRNAWCLVSGQNDMSCQISISLTQKAFRLAISGPGLRFVFIYMRTVRNQTGTIISRLGPAIQTKSDRPEFIVRPVSRKRIKRIIWRSIRTHACLSSSRSRVNIPWYPILIWLFSRTRVSRCLQHTYPSSAQKKITFDNDL